jgi:hypothetical protein
VDKINEINQYGYLKKKGNMAGIQASYNLYENAKMQNQKKEMRIKERNDELEDRLYNQSLYKSIDNSVKLYLKRMKN